MTSTQEREAKIRGRLEKAAPLPSIDVDGEMVVPLPYEKAVANAELIAHAPADLAWALERIEELRNERDAATKILDELETLTGFTASALPDEVATMIADLDWGGDPIPLSDDEVNAVHRMTRDYGTNAMHRVVEAAFTDDSPFPVASPVQRGDDNG